jgi:hypothetical protein
MLLKKIAVSFILSVTAWCATAGIWNDSTTVKINKTQDAGVTLSDTRNFHQLTVLPALHSSDPLIVPEQALSDSAQYHRSKALEYEEEVYRRGAMVGSLNELAAFELPVGLSRQVGPINYTVIISKLKGTLAGNVLEAYFLFEIPETGDKIAFRGSNISFSNTGGFTGTGRLELIGNYPIKLNEKTLFTLLGAKSSYVPSNSFVEFDCNGFKQMGIEAELEFSRDLIIPEDDLGKQKPAPERVKTKFATVVQSWNDLLLGVTIPSFQVNGLKDVGFSVTEAFLDWSDLANPSGMQFPAGYNSPFISAGQPNAWHGFFLKKLDVKLPPSFAKKEGAGRVAIGVENMILDDQGFTGKLFVENVLTAGDMSGWAYTIDKVGLELVINQVKGFELAGIISVPRLKTKEKEEATHFGYKAQRGADGNYIFAVTVENNLRLPLFMADVNLVPGSSVVVREKDNKFYPTAILNGDLTIKSSLKGVNANFNQIRFEGMRISSEEPRFDIQTLGFGNSEQQTISKFPVVISAISVKKEPQRLGIGFNLTINIGGKASEEGFGGTAALTVWSKEEQVQIKDAEGAVVRKTSDWKFEKIELSGVSINIKKPNAYDLTGTITFFDSDPIYGNGFRGTLTGTISKFGGLKTTALFGRTEKFRYWYADALITLEAGVPLVPGALFATGFGGGFYFKMKQTDKSPGSLLGETKSGIYYIPDENSMGIKAIMSIGTARPEAMNGDVGLEVLMNANGGINSVTMTGNANFMSLEKLAEKKMKELASSAAAGKLAEKLAGLLRGQVFGSMQLVFDNVNDVFHGNLEIYVNVAGGLMRGVGDGNRAGWAVLHFEKADWYVLIGTPDQPLGLEVAKIFKSKSYLMLGQHLPGSPPPPSQVTEILGDVDLDYMRDMNALQSGTGFAFGLNFIVDTGDLKFLMFYGRFSAGTGIDFMLKDYGQNYHCAGSTGPMGINGWYANGQAYAFVIGKIGVKVNLKFYKGNYDILSIGAAAILQAKGPNPFWMKGTVGGYYKILGGLVKGRCNFEVTVGKDCKPVGEQNLLDDVKMIAEISPVSGSKDVDVFTAPQIAFNIPVGEVFEITDLENKVHYFRAVLDEFTIVDGTQSLIGALQWNLDKDVVIFDGQEILPGEKTLKAKGKLTFEEQINSVWTKVKFDGKIVEETAETSFTTSKAPDYIPANNVAVSYPLIGQINFYPKEYAQGFIQLKDGQAYLFSPGKEWKQKIRMTNGTSFKYIESDLAYNATAKKVTFTLPVGFENSTVYMFEILNIPSQATIIDANVTKVETEIKTDPNAGTATLTTKDIQGMLDKREVKTVYTTSFRTSKYNTFGDKFKSITRGQSLRKSVARYAYVLNTYMGGDELLDAAELSGLMGTEKLIQMEAVLTGNSWYTNYPYPRLYESYPYYGWKVSRANPTALGVPPVKDMTFNNFTQALKLTEGDLAFTPVAFTTNEYVTYNVGQSVHSDYEAIKLQAVNYVANAPSRLNTRIEAIILKPAPFIKYGPYKVKVNYVIPGISKVSSSYEWEFFNYAPDIE